MASGNKTKAILKACRDQGITWEPTKGGHMRYFREDDPKNVVYASATPSDFRAEHRLIRDLVNRLGLVWPWNKKQARREKRS